MTPINVLLIDDNYAVNFLHADILETDFEKEVNEIKTFESAINAIYFLTERAEKGGLFPDLIFLDINMPRMNGWDFIEAIKDFKQLKETTIFIVSASDNPSDYEKANEIYADYIEGYVEKPLSDIVIAELIKITQQRKKYIAEQKTVRTL